MSQWLPRAVGGGGLAWGLACEYTRRTSNFSMCIVLYLGWWGRAGFPEHISDGLSPRVVLHHVHDEGRLDTQQGEVAGREELGVAQTALGGEQRLRVAVPVWKRGEEGKGWDNQRLQDESQVWLSN